MFQVGSFYTDTLSTSFRHTPPPPPPTHKAASFRVFDISVVKFLVSVGCGDILHVCDDKGSTYQNVSLVKDQ